MAGSSLGRGGFVQDELRPTEMPNTVAAPVDTFQRSSGNSAATQFLKGLGELAGPVTTAFKDYNKEAGDEAEAQANLKALQAKPEELRKEIESGNFFGMAQKRAQNAMHVMDAQNRVYEVSAKLDAMNQRGELAGADADGLIHGLVQSHADAVNASDNTLAMKAFTKGMVPVMRQYGTTILRANIAQEQSDKEAKLFTYMTNLHDQVDRDAEDDVSDEDLTKAHKQALFRTSDFAKKELLLSNDQTEKVLGKVAQHYASQGNVEALDAIGSYDRNGTPLSAKYGPQWDAWRKSAEAAYDAKAKEGVHTDVDGLTARAMRGEDKPEDFYKAVDDAHAKDPDNFGETRKDNLKRQFDMAMATRKMTANTQLAAQQEASAEREFVEQGAAALGKGEGYALPSEGRFIAADGKERLFKRKDYAERMYGRAEAVIDEQAKAQGWNAEQTAAAKVRLYGQNGDVAPTYKRSFDTLFATSRAGIDPNPQQLQQRLGALEFIRRTDAGQFHNLADERDKKQATWLAAYSAARDFGMDPDHAYLLSNQRVFNPAAQERVTAKEMSDKAEEVVKKFAGAGVLAGPIARQKAVDALNIQIAAGVSDKDLVDKAAASLSASHIVAGGVPVHNSLPGVGEASVAKEYLEDAARYFKRDNPRIKDQPWPVALADDPTKPGAYIAVRADTMERLSRESITGERVKDYVLQQRQRERGEKKRWNDWYKGLQEPKEQKPELSGD